MKSIHIPLLVLTLFCFAAVPSHSKNLLENSDFKERDADGLPKAWEMWATVLKPEKDSASFLRITANGGENAGGEQNVAVPPRGKQVTVSARVRAPDFAKRPGKERDHYEVYAAAKWPDGKMVYIGSAWMEKAERGWKRVEFTANIPAGATTVMAIFQIAGEGVLDITDMKLEIK